MREYFSFGKRYNIAVMDFADDGHTRYYKVRKPTAKKLWKSGLPITFCPSKLHPFGGRRPSVSINPKETDINQRTFDMVLGEFCFFNCNLHETGYYASYYVRRDDLKKLAELEMLMAAL